MKKTLLFLAILIGIFSLHAQQEPKIRFYNKDGNTKFYNISDINNIRIIKSETQSIMTIHHKVQNLSRDYDLSILEHIFFENEYHQQCNYQYDENPKF